MQRYYFKGRDQLGALVDGELNASNAESVATQLIAQGITPVTVNLHKHYSAKLNLTAILKACLPEQKVPIDDMIMFCRQMHTINKSGVPIIQGLYGICASLQSGLLKLTLEDVTHRLEAGVSLSAAMSAHPVVFDHLFSNMVKVGESSGTLDQTFKQLALYLQRDLETRRTIKAALRYPFFVMVAMVLAITVVNTKVIPAFTEMFKKFDAELPLMTKILIISSDLFVHYWWLLMVLSVFFVGGFLYWIGTDTGQYQWGKWKLRIPIVGDIIHKASLARYTRSFALMLQAGVPLIMALDLCAKVIDNYFLADKIQTIKKSIEGGDSLSRTHKKSDIFSPLVLQMITVGEGSGHVDVLLFDVANFYENEVEYELKNLSAKIEPILIIVMSLFVMVLALGIFLPMWELYAIR